MSKHTPKPWLTKPTASIGPQRAVYSETDPSGRDIAIVYDSENSEADANLIAAAPELLEALRECVTDDNANCIVTSDVCYMIRRFKAINAIVRTAIAKAEGKD